MILSLRRLSPRIVEVTYLDPRALVLRRMTVTRLDDGSELIATT